MRWFLIIKLIAFAIDQAITLFKKHWPKKVMVNQIQGEVKMAENVGTKELMELLDGVEALAVTAKQVMADGKVNLDDLPAAMALVAQSGKLVAAFQGLAAIPAEAKDIREDEAVEIVKKLYAIGAKVEA